jgi:hypothetical protein
MWMLHAVMAGGGGVSPDSGKSLHFICLPYITELPKCITPKENFARTLFITLSSSYLFAVPPIDPARNRPRRRQFVDLRVKISRLGSMSWYPGGCCVGFLIPLARFVPAYSTLGSTVHDLKQRFHDTRNILLRIEIKSSPGRLAKNKTT